MKEAIGYDVFDKVGCVNSGLRSCDGVVLQRCIARNDRFESGSAKTMELDFSTAIRRMQGRSNASDMQNAGSPLRCIIRCRRVT